MFLLTRQLTRGITHNTKKLWSEAQPIFKDYYSRRLTLTPQQLEQFLRRVTTMHFSEADHRWTSLLQNIQLNLPKYHPHSKVYMLKALTGMGSKSQLVGRLLQDLMKEVGQLDFEQSAVLLWCLCRCSGSNQIQDVAKVYRHICSILASHAEQGTVRIVIGRDDSDSFEKKTLVLHSTSVCMVLSAMGKLKISQKTILNHLIKDAIRPNIPVFSCNGLVTALIALQKLGFRNKRDFLHICLELMKRHADLEMEQLQTIANLAHIVSNLAISKHFDEAEADGRQKPAETVGKLRETRLQINRFLLWLCQTIQLRQKALSKEKAAKILHYCSKAEAFHPAVWSAALRTLSHNVQDCKVVDLVMGVKAIANLPDQQRKGYANEEQQISKRLWILHASITGKSLPVLARLYQQKRISPTTPVQELLTDYIEKRQKVSESRKDGGSKQESESE